MVLIDTNELRYWPALYESPEARDDAAAHDDTWSRSLIAKLANDLGSKPYFWFEQQPTSSSLGLWSVVEPPQSSSHGSIGQNGPSGVSLRPFAANCIALREGRPIQAIQSPAQRSTQAMALNRAYYDVIACWGNMYRNLEQRCLMSRCVIRRMCPAGVIYPHQAEYSAHYLQQLLK